MTVNVNELSGVITDGAHVCYWEDINPIRWLEGGGVDGGGGAPGNYNEILIVE